MKILGVGLSRTGTLSLYAALTKLGYKSIHYSPEMLNLNTMIFKSHANIDASVDLPQSFFYEHLLEEHNPKVILTIRDEENWYNSVRRHYSTLNSRMDAMIQNERHKHELKEYESKLRYKIYGTCNFDKDKYINTYRKHNDKITSTIPKDKLLIMNILEGDSWDKLCKFLKLPVINETFPNCNATKDRLRFVKIL